MTTSVVRWGEPWVVHEDEHVVVVSKPAGVNTHRADVGAQDGMYEWVRRQRPDVALSVLHRLDKETSGVLVFGKSPEANRALAGQFERRTADKTYDLITGAGGAPATLRCDDPIDGASASTEFALAGSRRGWARYGARPHSGRTHQVRIHASALGLPILGDVDHGGAPAARVHLHAASIAFEHPVAGDQEHVVASPASFGRLLADDADPLDVGTRLAVAHEARAVLFDPDDTDAYLWADRHHDGFADLRIERLGRVAFVLDYRERDEALEPDLVDGVRGSLDLEGVFVQRRPRGGGGGPAQRLAGAADPRFWVTELGVRYRIDLGASATSSGLFLDQRETRRELLGVDRAGTTVLNTFAHTGALSVAAASAGAETVTLDLSKHYLDWARENFGANGIDPDDHDFIYGDALDWMARLARKGRRFDAVLVDPPTSSTTRRRSKRWTVARDLDHLVSLAAQLCGPGGSIYVSTNFRRMTWDSFTDHVARGLATAGRSGRLDLRTLPLDHRSGGGDPPYLKGAWIQLDD